MLPPETTSLVICGGKRVPVTLIIPALLRELVFQLKPGQSAGNEPTEIAPLKFALLNNLKLSPELSVPAKLVTFKVPPRLIDAAFKTSFVPAALLISIFALPCSVAFFETVRRPMPPAAPGETAPPTLTVRLVTPPVPPIVPFA